MPVFVAFAAFMLILYGHHFGLRVPPLPGFEGLFRGPRKSAGQKSGVRTDTIEVVLDHDSGSMQGRCLKGQFAGRELASLREAELLRLLDEIGGADSQGAALPKPISTGAAKDGASGGQLAARRNRREPRDTNGGMSRKEAYEVLDLKPGAGGEAVRAAHRRLMMKLHPDRGGWTYLPPASTRQRTFCSGGGSRLSRASAPRRTDLCGPAAPRYADGEVRLLPRLNSTTLPLTLPDVTIPR